MSNSYFKFKQFTIHQAVNPMKVCTDSCLFGAWIPITGNSRVLDIGTGTGLLSLMMAQRSNGLVDAVELQNEAAQEATENISQSLWSQRIHVYQGNILDTTLPVYHNRYDTIVCNPPFYSNHLQSDDPGDITARHDVELPLDDLMKMIERLLTEGGSAFLLLPYEPFKNVTSIVTKSKLKLTQAVAVKNFENKSPIRWMVELKHESEQTSFDEIVIYNSDRTYTEEFTQLLQPFYLYL